MFFFQIFLSVKPIIQREKRTATKRIIKKSQKSPHIPRLGRLTRRIGENWISLDVESSPRNQLCCTVMHKIELKLYCFTSLFQNSILSQLHRRLQADLHAVFMILMLCVMKDTYLYNTAYLNYSNWKVFSVILKNTFLQCLHAATLKNL